MSLTYLSQGLAFRFCVFSLDLSRANIRRGDIIAASFLNSQITILSSMLLYIRDRFEFHTQLISIVNTHAYCARSSICITSLRELRSWSNSVMNTICADRNMCVSYYHVAVSLAIVVYGKTITQVA